MATTYDRRTGDLGTVLTADRWVATNEHGGKQAMYPWSMAIPIKVAVIILPIEAML
jgi:hypothetical protein